MNSDLASHGGEDEGSVGALAGPPSYSAFRRHELVCAGSLRELALALRALLDAGDTRLILIFDDATGRQLDIDLRGPVEDLERRYADAGEAAPAEATRKRGPGRPKLGVVGREITLLPRHWRWLQTQRGGPSATLRRLVDEARGANLDRDRMRAAQDSINRFISGTAGDLPGFEEANRALYRGDRARFEAEIQRWPRDVRDYIEHWVGEAFGSIA